MNVVGPSTGGASSVQMNFGQTYVLQPTGRHTVTVVWLHGLGTNGICWKSFIQQSPGKNTKWIFSTAPCDQ